MLNGFLGCQKCEWKVRYGILTDRILVGLRWWSEIKADGREEWYFESLNVSKFIVFNAKETQTLLITMSSGAPFMQLLFYGRSSLCLELYNSNFTT